MTILTAALLAIFQADGGAAPSLKSGSSAIADMLGNIGTVATCVLVLLFLASLYSWTVILSKLASFSKATKESRRFIRAFRKATRLQEIATLAADCKASPLAQVYEDVYEAYRRQTGGSGPPRHLVPLERSAQTAASEAVTALERRMTWLATIASVSPFVGLFGTVVGIIDSFSGLGSAGAATLRAVAPGISEALITTATGIGAAIPAVVAYNHFAGQIRRMAVEMDGFSQDFINIVQRNVTTRRG